MTRRAVAVLAAAALAACGPTEQVLPATLEPGLLTACVVTPGGPDATPGDATSAADEAVLRALADRLGVALSTSPTGVDAALSGAATASQGCDVVAGGLGPDVPADVDLVASVPFRDRVLQLLAPGAPGVTPVFAAGQPLGHLDEELAAGVAADLTPHTIAYPSRVDAVAGLATGGARALLLDPDLVVGVLAEVDGVRVVGAVPTGRPVVLLHRAGADPDLVAQVDAALAELAADPDVRAAVADQLGPTLVPAQR